MAASAGSGSRITAADIPDRLPESEEEADRYAAGDIGKAPRASDVFDVTELRSIGSFDDAIALLADKGESVTDASKEMGTGFRVLNGDDKSRLCGVSFVILSMDFNHGDAGDFVSFLCVTEENGKYIVNDGSTGIHKQLEEYRLRGGNPRGLLVPGGLRKSEYTKEIDGKPTQATTFYLNV